MTEAIKKHPVLYFFAAITLLGLALRTLCFVLDPIPQRDTATYIAYAEYIMEHGIGKPDAEFIRNFPQALWLPPLYIILIAALSAATNFSPLLCGFLISAIATTAVAIVVFFTAKEIAPKEMPHFPFVAALLAEFHPALVRMGYSVLRDGLSLLLIAALIYFLVRLLHADRLTDSVFFGVILALAILCRFETLEFFILLFLCYMMACIQKKKTWIKSFLSLSVILAVTLLMLASFSLMQGKTLSLPLFLREILKIHLNDFIALKECLR